MAEKNPTAAIDAAVDAVKQFQAGKASIAGVARLVGALSKPELAMVCIGTRLPMRDLENIAALSKQLV